MRKSLMFVGIPFAVVGVAVAVVAGARPFSSGVRTTANFLKAEASAADGGAISILTAEELRERIAVSSDT